MFTGIVQELAKVAAITHQPDLSRLTLDMGKLANGAQLGASIAVNGVCLTVTATQGDHVNFDIIKETLEHSNLRSLREGAAVNVERSFRVGDEIGGHVVSGHVGGESRVLERRVIGHDHVLRLALPLDLKPYVFHKGFVALDGASLTVSQVDSAGEWFEISLIPETLQRTTLGFVAVGETVNLEVEAQTVTTVDTVKNLMSDPLWLQQMSAQLRAAEANLGADSAVD